MRAGLIDADLGNGLLKKRITIPGGGKRGGARVIVATQRVDRWFFLIGFLKNQKANLRQSELASLKSWAAELLALNEQQLDSARYEGRLHEIDHHPSTPH